MKQIIQSFKTGDTLLEDVPAPNVKHGQVLIKTSRSLVSLGTERMLVEFGKANLIAKAKQQPDKVKEVLQKIKAEGLMPTLEAVFNKLGQPLPLGYCNVGEVIDVGEGVAEFKIGDRVASNGPHAEFVSVPKNLVAKVPDNVSDSEASFTIIGAIGLQGIRLLNPTLGETVVVIGLGLIGLMTAQLLKANGCKVIGYDLDDKKVKIAADFGIDAFNPAKGTDPIKFVEQQTGGIGADGIIITASAKTNTIISDAAKMSRKRGRIVLVGVIGLDISRADFYEKELFFQVSCSYGPGRYDDDYENKGIDYPLPFVRWTEKRNFETILQAISNNNIEVKSLITEEVSLNDYQNIYSNIGASDSIASILTYDKDVEHEATVVVTKNNKFEKSKGILGIVGAGNFAKMTMLPHLDSIDAKIKYIASAGGVNSTYLAKKFNISKSTTDYQHIIEDKEVDTVLITTRHNLHAKMALQALQANKHVFVEKPLALSLDELEAIQRDYEVSNKTLTVGFNRRFSPHIQKMKSLLGNSNVMNITATMNAGYIPADVWVHDMKIGGGRIIGEACHYIDLMIFLTGSKVKEVCMNSMGVNALENTDNASMLLKFENGSNGVINYFANGSKSYSKERVEVFSQEKTLIMDNFRTTRGYGFKNFKKLKTKLDKGHREQFSRFIKSVQNGGEALIPFEEIENTSLTVIKAIESLKSKSWVTI